MIRIGLTMESVVGAALTTVLAAQVPTSTTLVLTRLTGAFASQLLGVDGNGAISAFGRFPSDVLPPLAVEVDPFDHQALVAVDLGNGLSRVLRLVPGPGATFSGELPLADLPGRCTQLIVRSDDVLATVDGAGGGIFRVPRRGGAAVLLFARAEASAMFRFGSGLGNTVLLCWSGTSGPPATAPGIAYVDTATGAAFGSYVLTNLPGSQITGLIDLPVPPIPPHQPAQELVAFADGTFALHFGAFTSASLVPMSPQPPAGGAAAFKPDPSSASSGLAVGGVSYPFLYRATWNGSGTTAVVAGPLPGDPVDLALPLPSGPQVLLFGSGCGVPSLGIGSSGAPQVGNLSFALLGGGALPQQLCAFVAGFDDVLGGVLPFPLPGGCVLQTSPDAVVFSLADSGGSTQQSLPIPPQPAFAGTLLFAQWLEVLGAGFATSGGAAIQIGL